MAKRCSESTAVGSRAFVEGVRADLGSRGRHRSIDDVDDVSLLWDPCGRYTPIFATEIIPPSWNSSPETHVSRSRSGTWNGATPFKNWQPST